MEPVARALSIEFSYKASTGELFRRGVSVDPDHNPSFHGKRIDHATICWVLYYGEFPKGIVDHKNRIGADHRIENLRDATPTRNQQNKAGYGQYAKGVTWRNRKEKPYQAKIRVNGDRIHLGSFATEEEAAEAYRQAAFRYHGEFACVE